jgi:hypothetical protein
LLAHGLAGQLQFVGKLGDGARTLALERDEDGAAAFRKLFDGQNGGAPGRRDSESRFQRFED